MVEQPDQLSSDQNAIETQTSTGNAIGDIKVSTRESIEEETWWKAIKDFWGPLINPPKHEGPWF